MFLIGIVYLWCFEVVICCCKKFVNSVGGVVVKLIINFKMFGKVNKLKDVFFF